MTDIENRVVDEVEKVVKGKRDIIIKVYAAILAGGHIPVSYTHLTLPTIA